MACAITESLPLRRSAPILPRRPPGASAPWQWRASAQADAVADRGRASSSQKEAHAAEAVRRPPIFLRPKLIASGSGTRAMPWPIAMAATSHPPYRARLRHQHLRPSKPKTCFCVSSRLAYRGLAASAIFLSARGALGHTVGHGVETIDRRAGARRDRPVRLHHAGPLHAAIISIGSSCAPCAISRRRARRLRTGPRAYPGRG